MWSEIEKRGAVAADRNIAKMFEKGNRESDFSLQFEDFLFDYSKTQMDEDDRAALYGAFLTVAAKLRGPDGAQALVLFRRKGKRVFEAEQSG